MKRKRSCGCFSIPVLIMLTFLLIVFFNNSTDRAEDVSNNVSVSSESSKPTVVISTTQPELTSTPKTDPTPTQSIIDSIYAHLVSELDGETIILVELDDQSLVIHTNIDRSDLVLFYEDIGTIHGVVVSENPIIDRVVLSDVTGQQIFMSYQEMINFYEQTITWDQFRDTWEIINP